MSRACWGASHERAGICYRDLYWHDILRCRIRMELSAGDHQRERDMEHVRIGARQGAGCRLTRPRCAEFSSLQRPANDRCRPGKIRMRLRKSDGQGEAVCRGRVRLHRLDRFCPYRRRRPDDVAALCLQALPRRGRRQNCRPEHADIARRAVDDQDHRKSHPQVERRNDGTTAWPAGRTDSGGGARFGGPAEISRLIGFASLSRGRMGASSTAFRFGRGGATSR